MIEILKLYSLLVLISRAELGLSYEFYDDLYYDQNGSNTLEEGHGAWEEGGRGTGEGGEGTKNTRIPNFTSPSLDIVANPGETVRFPCTVDKLQGFVLIWKKGEDIICLGSTLINHAGTHYLIEVEEEGISLVLRGVSERDQGEYVCQVSAYKPSLMKHKLTIRTKPVIQTIPQGSVIVKEGTNVSLLCTVLSGSPYPSLTWRKKGDETHLETENVGELVLRMVSRHDKGLYTCTASNGYSGDPVVQSVELYVQYAPELSIDEIHMPASERDDVVEGEEGEDREEDEEDDTRIELVCRVSSFPSAIVTWSKLTSQQPEIIPAYSQSIGSIDRYTIYLDINSMGTYACQATNEVGSTQKQILLAEFALSEKPIELDSNPRTEKHDYAGRHGGGRRVGPGGRHRGAGHPEGGEASHAGSHSRINSGWIIDTHRKRITVTSVSEGVLDDTNVPLYSGGPPGKYEFNLTYSTLCMIILLCCVV